jgi:hypothetical protein
MQERLDGFRTDRVGEFLFKASACRLERKALVDG